MNPNLSGPIQAGRVRQPGVKGWRCLAIGLVASLAIGALLVWCDHRCRVAAQDRVFWSLESVPVNDVGLVLGTGSKTRQGRPNLHFARRMAAAAVLYRTGKVRHLLVSGDNRGPDHDEPTDMREALVAAGVPTNAITCDYAGFRTLDSVVRARKVFGLQHCTIVSEAFHCPRALWIAGRHGLDAVAYAAPDLNVRWPARAKTREVLARAWCAVELYVLRRGPRFAGPPEPIQLTATTP